MKALIDTGAQISCINDILAAEIGEQIEPHISGNIVGADGKILPIKGRIKSNIELKDTSEKLQCELFILENCNPPIILGMDFLKLRRAKIDCGNNEMLFENAPRDVYTDAVEERITRVIAIEDKLISGGSLTKLEVSLSRSLGESIIISNNPVFTQKTQMFCTRSVVKPKSKQCQVWILNTLQVDFKVLSGSTVGFAEEILANDNNKLTVAGLSEDNSETKGNFIICSKLTQGERSTLLNTLTKNEAIFASRDEDVGRTSLIKHHINTGDHPPSRQHPYRASRMERDLISSKIKEMLSQGIISPSSGPWAAPVILVKKKNGEFRFCVDYRKLNRVTVKDVYPLPRIDDTLDALGGAKWFSALDLKNGYWQIEVDSKDREKTAFVTPGGLYQFNVMPFGLCNAPATFERLMDNILRSLCWEVCLCYLDDIIIFSEDFVEHVSRIERVLDCLKHAGLTLNKKKCRFAFRELTVFGHVVSSKGISPDPEKIEPVIKFPIPKNIRHVRSFIGICSYYRRFIPDFSKIAHPLHSLLHKDCKFIWGSEQQEAFETLKTRLTSFPILSYFDPKRETILNTDASGHGIGAVLAQTHGKDEKPIAYASRTLSEAERNYSTTERECLAVVWAITKFRPYLFGKCFTVVSDHHSLCWLSTLKGPSGRLARWALKLQEFDMIVKYKSGKKHQDADALSRCPLGDDLTGETKAVLSICAISVEECQNDHFIKSILDGLKTRDTCQLSMNQNFTVKDGLLYKKNPSAVGSPWLLVVPDSQVRKILADLHDHPTSGHLGITKTYGRIKNKFFWPNMYKNTRSFVKTCRSCQSRKHPTRKPPGLLQPIPTALTPFQRVGIDLLGRFPTSSHGNKWIVVCTDYHSKYAETAALSRATAEEVADFLLHSVILRHGAPRSVLSDRGSQFTSHIFRHILELCGSIQLKTTAYHPQTNGLTERLNRTLADMLSLYVDEDQKNWDSVLPFVTFAYNTAVQETTGYSPYFLLHGHDPCTFLDTMLPLPPNDYPESYDDYILQMVTKAEDTRILANQNNIASQNYSKSIYDKRHRMISYSPGDLVWVWTPVRRVGLSEKLIKQYYGPYKILARLSPITYEVEALNSRSRRTSKDIVNVSRLKPYLERK